MKKILLLFLLIASVSFGQSYSATDSVIVTSTNAFHQRGRGFKFTPNNNITITKFGKRVPNALGTYTWVIWEVNSQTKIHEQVSTSTLAGQYTYEPTTNSLLTLTGGTEYLCILYCDSTIGAEYYYGSSTQINSNLTYDNAYFCNSCTTNDYPSSIVANHHYGTPDFHFINCTQVTSTTSLAICDDQLPYSWNGLTFNTAGSQSTTLQSSLGCDSVATLNLTLNSVDTSITSLAICDDQIPYTWNGLTFTAAGSQATILQTSLGCDSVAILNLTVNSVDTSTTTNGVNITSNATNATYQWLDCDSNYVIISGETDSSFTATTNGNYAVAVTQNGCTDTSSCVLINSVQITSNFNNVVSVYPNPSSDIITLKGINSLTEVSHIHLLDNKGALLKKIGINETKVDLSSFSTGIYFIEIKHQLGTGRIKVVKQ